MKSFLVLLFVNISFLGIELSELREKFPEANTNAEATDYLYHQLSHVSLSDSPKFLAYKGAVLSLKAKHAKTIKEKKEFFKEGVNFLESAIEAAPTDIEIRCLRLSVQEHAPKIVKYNANIDADKIYILEHNKNQKNVQLKEFIKNCVLESSLFTDEEKRSF